MSDQPTLFPDRHEAKPQELVECLGMTFPNDEERRKHFPGEVARRAARGRRTGHSGGDEEAVRGIPGPAYQG